MFIHEMISLFKIHVPATVGKAEMKMVLFGVKLMKQPIYLRVGKLT